MATLVNLSERQGMDKEKALETALSQIERSFGKGSIMKLGQDNPVSDIEAVSTGSIGLDLALGIGGLPKGSIIEIFGPESSEKQPCIACYCRRAKEVVSVLNDAEHALDPI